MSKSKRIEYRRDARGIVIGEGGSALTREIVLVNPDNRWFTDGGSFVLHFGAYGWTVLRVWERSLDDALDTAIDWIVEHAPGLLCDEAVAEEYNRAIAEGKSEDEAMEIAEQDTTSGGSCGNRVLSYEWGILAENPTRDEIAALIGL